MTNCRALRELDEQFILEAKFGQGEFHPLKLGGGIDVPFDKIALTNLSSLTQAGRVGGQLEAITQLGAVKGVGLLR